MGRTSREKSQAGEEGEGRETRIPKKNFSLFAERWKMEKVRV
jgi:hypothetical protein